jgi:hypothetical protein
MSSLVRKHGLRQQERNSVREIIVGEAGLGNVNVNRCFTTGEQYAIERRENLIQFLMAQIPMDRNNIVIS